MMKKFESVSESGLLCSDFHHCTPGSMAKPLAKGNSGGLDG